MSDANASLSRCVRRVAGVPCADLSDAQLLGSVVSRKDETAFEVLMWRHGPKVLGICRRVLLHEQDAEDAFQATFLMLVREAAAIGKHEAVGSWLYRVAYRVALRAKLLAGKRTTRELPTEGVPAIEQIPDLVWADLRPVLDEEVNRLPTKYRVPFVLCHVDGKTNEEAARELGCPKGTILSRLAWARERLRTRLTRRGLTLPAGLLVAAVATDPAAAVPASLVDSTLKAGVRVAEGVAIADAAAGPVAALVAGASRTMFWTKGAFVALCVLAVGALGIGGGLGQRTGGAEAATGQAAGMPEQPKTEQKANQKAGPKDAKTFELEFRNASWDKVLEWYSEISGLAFVGTIKPTGSLTLVSPKGKRYTLVEVTDLINEALAAQNMILVRRTGSFTLLPADEPFNPTLIPLVGLDELDKRGRTELVRVVIPLNNATAAVVAPDVEKLLGPFGKVRTLDQANQLVVQDTAGNIELIIKTVKSIEIRAEMKQTEPKK